MESIEKTILQHGTEPPSEHDRVVLTVTLTVNKEVVFDSVEVMFDVGHAEDFGIIKLLDKVAADMGLGERCLVRTSPAFALTPSEMKNLGVEVDMKGEMIFDVFLSDIRKLNKFWEMSEADKLSVALVMKRRANKLFEAKQYTRAFKTYKIGINLLRGSASVSKPLYPLSETDSLPKAPFSPEACNLLVLCEANAALCLLRLALLPHDSNGELKRNPKDTQKLLRLCTKHCHRAVKLDPGYAKAWFRLAKALAELGDYDEAVEAGQKCLGSLKNAGVSTSGTLVSEVNSFLARWRVEAEKSNSAERSAVRSAVLRRYNGDYYAWSDDEDEVEKLPISVWSNSLAENMMSLHEELEAFGEKMPEPKSSRSRTSRRLEPVPDEYSDEEKFE